MRTRRGVLWRFNGRRGCGWKDVAIVVIAIGVIAIATVDVGGIVGGIVVVVACCGVVHSSV